MSKCMTEDQVRFLENDPACIILEMTPKMAHALETTNPHGTTQWDKLVRRLKKQRAGNRLVIYKRDTQQMFHLTIGYTL